MCTVLEKPERNDTKDQRSSVSGGVGVPTGEYVDHDARMLGRRAVPRVPRAAMLAGTGLANRVGMMPDLSPAGVRYLADRRGTYSIDKARRLLGWTPQVDLQHGMALTRDWLAGQGLLAR